MNAEAAVWGSPSPGVEIYGLKPSKAVLGYGDAPGGGEGTARGGGQVGAQVEAAEARAAPGVPPGAAPVKEGREWQRDRAF